MSRICEMHYDKNIWSISSKHAERYVFRKKDSGQTYLIRGNITGLEQIKCKEDTFLIYFRDSWFQSKVVRLKLSDGNTTEEYSHSFKIMDYITNDCILFDKNSSYSTTLYSLSKNSEIDFLEPWLDSIKYKSRNISLCQDSLYPTYLNVEYELFSKYLKAYIQLLVDPVSLQPLSPVYSTIREDFVSFKDILTLNTIFKDDYSNLTALDIDFESKFFNPLKKTDLELIRMRLKSK